MNKHPSLVVLGMAAAESKGEPLPCFLAPIPAGFPSPADDALDESLDLHSHLVRNPAATFFLRACGDSMREAGILDGDLLIVDRSLDAAHNRVVIAAVDGELTVKRLIQRKGRTLLMPANPDYDPLDITEREDLHIWGVVTHAIHKV